MSAYAVLSGDEGRGLKRLYGASATQEPLKLLPDGGTAGDGGVPECDEWEGGEGCAGAGDVNINRYR